MKLITSLLKALAVSAVLAAIIILGSICSHSLPHDKVDSTQDPVLQTLIAGLKDRESKAKSASGYIVEEIYNSQDSTLLSLMQQKGVDPDFIKFQKKPVRLTTYFWASDGDKVRDDTEIVIGGKNHQWQAYNGKRTQQWFPGSSNANEYGNDAPIIGGLALELQLPLGRGLAAFSMSKLIDKQETSIIGSEILGGVKTYRVETLPVPGQEISAWWIAPDLGYLVVKSELRPAPDSGGVARIVRVVDKVRKVSEGLWIPVIFREVGYVSPKDKGQMWRQTIRYSAMSFKVNEPVPSQLFDLPLPPGTTVGGVGREIYKVKGDKETFEAQLAEAKKRGEQPDMDSIELDVFKSRIAKVQPPPEDLLDVPTQNLAGDK